MIFGRTWNYRLTAIGLSPSELNFLINSCSRNNLYMDAAILLSIFYFNFNTLFLISQTQAVTKVEKNSNFARLPIVTLSSVKRLWSVERIRSPWFGKMSSTASLYIWLLKIERSKCVYNICACFWCSLINTCNLRRLQRVLFFVLILLIFCYAGLDVYGVDWFLHFVSFCT